MQPLEYTAALLCLFSAACYSGVSATAVDTDGPLGGATSTGADGDSGSDDSGSSDDAPTPEFACDESPFSISAAPLRGLTRAQFRNSVEDLLGSSQELDDAFERLGDLVDGKVGQFSANVSNPDQGVARTYMLIAENIAGVIEARPDVMPTCPLSDITCVEPFFETFGQRVFRRPLRDEELQRYLDLWSSQRDLHDGATGVRAALSAMFASPNFLYIEEPVLEGEGDFLELENYALATRLSYYLWQSGPDQQLLTIAASGTLQEDDILAAQVDRMIEDPRFDRALENFHTQLVGLDRLATFETPAEGWSDDLRHEMMAEIGAFARYVFAESSGSIDELLTADYTVGTPDLAEIYGSAMNPDGIIPLDPAHRSGLLTQTGFLTMTGGVAQEVHRGLFVRRSLMCEHPPELSEQQQEEIDLDPAVDRLNTPLCAACHVYTDPVGFGLSKYGSLGEYLEDDPVDASGEIVPLTPGGLEGTFEGAPELAQLLADSESVERCFTVQWSRFAMQRLETEEDACVLQALGDQTLETEGDLPTLVRSIALSPRFRVRRADSFTE